MISTTSSLPRPPERPLGSGTQRPPPSWGHHSLLAGCHISASGEAPTMRPDAAPSSSGWPARKCSPVCAAGGWEYDQTKALEWTYQCRTVSYSRHSMHLLSQAAQSPSPHERNPCSPRVQSCLETLEEAAKGPNSLASCQRQTPLWQCLWMQWGESCLDARVRTGQDQITFCNTSPQNHCRTFLPTLSGNQRRLFAPAGLFRVFWRLLAAQQVPSPVGPLLPQFGVVAPPQLLIIHRLPAIWAFDILCIARCKDRLAKVLDGLRLSPFVTPAQGIWMTPPQWHTVNGRLERASSVLNSPHTTALGGPAFSERSRCTY